MYLKSVSRPIHIINTAEHAYITNSTQHAAYSNICLLMLAFLYKIYAISILIHILCTFYILNGFRNNFEKQKEKKQQQNTQITSCTYFTQ